MSRLVDTLRIFNPSRPVFVKIPFQSSGRVLDAGERFNWEFFQVPFEKVHILFLQGMIGHNPELEESAVKKVSIGDGLEELTIDELHVLVGNINAKVKEKTKNNGEFLSKKCATSKLKDKQIGLIRRWRMTYGDME